MGHGMKSLWFYLALNLELLASVGFIVYLIKQRKKVFKVSFGILVAGFTCHTVFLACQYLYLGVAPAFDLKSSLSIFSWSIVAVYLIFHIKFRLMVLSSFVAPFASSLMIISSTMSHGEAQVRPDFKSIILTAHIMTAFLGNALFTVAFFAGLMYLILEHAIKHKKFGALYHRLPSLATLDAINYHSLVYGFSFLTFGMISGSFFSNQLLSKYWQWDPKEVWSLISWFFCAALIHGRIAIGWRGRKAAILSTICFCLLLFTFLGGSLWMSGYHSFKSLGH